VPYDDGTPYNEADTRAKLIDPALRAAGWGESQIEREHYFIRNRQITDGRIFLTGERARRRAPKKVDYLLRYHSEMLAVVEAKEESEAVEAGLGQAREYAELLKLLFAYSSNGHGFAEYDAFLNQIENLCDPFPAPEDLWRRLELNEGVSIGTSGGIPADPRRHPLLCPPCPAAVTGKELRYYQEAAIRAAIERMMRGRQRILLTLATGTGKTFIAFQIVWKLRRSGWLRKPILFLCDRVPLRAQAFNTFGPFATVGSDPRDVIETGAFNANRELYFGLYQTLDAGKDEPLFERIPEDFFGLVIIDECHRSGFGKWNRILRHFEEAIQLGMTATPKRTESVDTYAYFCREEPEGPVDPGDPSKGKWRPPAFTYSLGQGIDDGFLATYKVHKVRTNIDKEGLTLEDAQAQGAEIYVPEEVTPRDLYETAQFEREIRLPDRTKTIVEHLSGLLRTLGPMEKTIAFCVDIEHARLVANLLQNAFADLGLPDYAVPIVSEEPEAITWLERFQDSDRRTPVIATTAELLTTGVDVPACRNIVFIKPIGSQILFKQIIGRGSRVDPATGKEWFRIIDYVSASRLFDDWDRPPGEAPPELTAERTSGIRAEVVDSDTGFKLVGASVTALIGPNLQAGPKRTDDDGFVFFDGLPATAIGVVVAAPVYSARTVSVETAENETSEITIELRLAEQPPNQVRVRGLQVTIAEEATFLIEETGEQMTLDEYRAYVAERVRTHYPSEAELRDGWVDPAERTAFLAALAEETVQVEVLRDLTTFPDADDYDVLRSVAFGGDVFRRTERAQGLRNVHAAWLDELEEPQREVAEALIEKYVLGGVTEIAAGDIFRLEPFRSWGQAPGVAARFEGVEALAALMRELQEKLYSIE
jgi:type I restriction enzyme, R subunit